MGKLADDFRSIWSHAHPDQHLEISLLDLFSYDRLSTVPPEKGWILPLESYPSKLVGEMMASGLLMELMLWRLAARAGVGMARRAAGAL